VKDSLKVVFEDIFKIFVPSFSIQRFYLMSSSSITNRQRIGRLIMPLLFIYFRAARGMTLGVRAAVLDESDRVFLVRHTYVPGWHMPGGGIEVGETALQALERELEEEGHIRLDGPADLRGLYWNREANRRDHVAFFLVRTFSQEKPRLPDAEIAEAGFFPLDALPEDTTNATRRRLDEIAGKRLPDGFW
jgi:ADP-ribose pyrophosphatase YjhB (NUDIX family)